MANSFVDILRLIEAHVPQSQGGTNFDETLRASLVSFANMTLAEIDRVQRWSLAYAEPTITTSPGVEAYALPYPAPAGLSSNQVSPLSVSRVYYINSTGRPILLEFLNQYEAQRVWGEQNGLGANASAPPTDAPQAYSILPYPSTQGGIDYNPPQMSLLLYPAPDNQGPETNGNYKIRVAGYWETPPLVETVGNIAGVTTLTFSTPGSGNYLMAQGLPIVGSNFDLNVAIRNGGNPTGLTQFPNDTHICNWTTLNANTATLAVAPNITANTLPVYFNGDNWIIRHWPKLLLFGIMREIGNYYGKAEMFQVWDVKFKEQMQALHEYEFDRQRSIEMMAAAITGQKGSSKRVQDLQPFLDVRGTGGF